MWICIYTVFMHIYLEIMISANGVEQFWLKVLQGKPQHIIQEYFSTTLITTQQLIGVASRYLKSGAGSTRAWTAEILQLQATSAKFIKAVSKLATIQHTNKVGWMGIECTLVAWRKCFEQHEVELEVLSLLWCWNVSRVDTGYTCWL